MRSGVNVAANIAAASDLIRVAASDGASFIATPEMTHLLQRDPKLLRYRFVMICALRVFMVNMPVKKSMP